MKEFNETILRMVTVTIIVFAGMLLSTAAMPYLFEFIQTSNIGIVTAIPVGIGVGAIFSFLLMGLAEFVVNEIMAE